MINGGPMPRIQVKKKNCILNMNHMLTKFAKRTTLHGVQGAILSRSPIKRIIWWIIFLAATGMFLVQFSFLLKKYYSYGKEVDIEIVQRHIPFPAISICNLRSMDAKVLNKINRLFIDKPDAHYHYTHTNDSAIREYMKVFAKYGLLYKKHWHKYHSIFEEVLSSAFFAANIDKSVIGDMGVQLDDFIVTCRLGGTQCNRSDVLFQFFHPRFYNCFTYNSSAKGIPIGIENGWSSVVFTGSAIVDKNTKPRFVPGTHDTASPISGSDGVHVVIHAPKVDPYPLTQGYDVPSITSVSFGIKASMTERLGFPYGNCIDADDTYNLVTCQKRCMQNAIVAECKCTDILLPDHDSMHVPWCLSDNDVSTDCAKNATRECLDALFAVYDRLKCAESVRSRLAANTSSMANCGCYPPCKEINYEVTYSLSKWPAPGVMSDATFIEIFQSNKYGQRLSPNYYQYFINKSKDADGRAESLSNFVRLNVYIADNNVMVTKESPNYTLTQLLSDIGGQMGLWIGCSVITLAEVVELFLQVIRNGLKGKKRTPSHRMKPTVNNKEPNDGSRQHMVTL